MDQTSLAEKIYQRGKFDDIIEALVSAGYFRARINTLSDFDKIVGGLCWCITSSGEDVDVDILFSENSTIGQRIALSEAITTALRKMNCPLQLQPHQIQGGVGGTDFAAISPIIKWLIKTYLERREKTDTTLRKYAIFQFFKNYSLGNQTKSEISSSLVRINHNIQPTRLYKRTSYNHNNISEESQVRACLLEYGEFSTLSPAYNNTPQTIPGANPTPDESIEAQERSDERGAVTAAGGSLDLASITKGLARLRTRGSGGAAMSSFDHKLLHAQRQAQREETQIEEQLQSEQRETIQSLETIDAEDTITSFAALRDFLDSTHGSAQHGSLELQAAMMTSNRLSEAEVMELQKQMLLEKKRSLEIQEVEINAEQERKLEELRILEEEKMQLEAREADLRSQLMEFSRLEHSSDRQTEIKELNRLLDLHARLQSEERQFKASCRSQLQELTDTIQQLEAGTYRGEGVDPSELKKMAEIKDMHAKVLNKHTRLRELIAEANQQASVLVRKIDEVPTRPELLQYERRFVEVYQQIGWKLEETRKYYDTYNNLNTLLGYLQKEVKLLDTIGSSFSIGMRSAQHKAEFLQQFRQIVRSVQESVEKQEDVLSRKQQVVETKKEVLRQLTEQQRAYVKAVQEMQEECLRNEYLTENLRRE